MSKLLADVHGLNLADEDLWWPPGTSTPASLAILYAGCPTILAFSAPFTRMVLRTLSISPASGNNSLCIQILF